MELHHQATVPQSPKLKHLFCRVALVAQEIGHSVFSQPSCISFRRSRTIPEAWIGSLLSCVIPAKAGIQSPGTCSQVWMPAFAGMTLTFLSHPGSARNGMLFLRGFIFGAASFALGPFAGMIHLHRLGSLLRRR